MDAALSARVAAVLRGRLPLLATQDLVRDLAQHIEELETECDALAERLLEQHDVSVALSALLPQRMEEPV